MREYLFTINEKNAYNLQDEYNFDLEQTEYIRSNFWPIIILTDIDESNFENLLNNKKKEFITKRGQFDLTIFKRNYLDYLIIELNEYLSNFKKSKNTIYDYTNGIYFHWFKLETDKKSHTLLLTNKDEIDLEIYFKKLLSIIESFISEKNITLQTQLPTLNDSVIVHYGCSDFNSNEHKVYWIGAISHTPNKDYFFESKNEVELIEKFYKYVQDKNEKTFIHWSMNSPKYGFKAIENRYFELTNNSIHFDIKNEIDLSEYLKNKYGINYIERQSGRLNNLAILNGFSGLQSEVEVININDATNRLELIFSIVQAEIQGYLKTNTALPPQQTTTENDTIKYTAKHYVLGYLIECNAKGESFPMGQKKELEKIGNKKMGTGKGNRFYKVFNELVNKDLNIENNLIEIGGENWRSIVKDLSKEPESIETYLQSKQL